MLMGLVLPNFSHTVSRFSTARKEKNTVTRSANARHVLSKLLPKFSYNRASPHQKSTVVSPYAVRSIWIVVSATIINYISDFGRERKYNYINVRRNNFRVRTVFGTIKTPVFEFITVYLYSLIETFSYIKIKITSKHAGNDVNVLRWRSYCTFRPPKGTLVHMRFYRHNLVEPIFQSLSTLHLHILFRSFNANSQANGNIKSCKAAVQKVPSGGDCAEWQPEDCSGNRVFYCCSITGPFSRKV